MELTKEQTRELINTLLDVLTLNDYILRQCFEDNTDSIDRDDFFDTVHTDALEAGVRTVAFLENIVGKYPSTELNSDGTKLFEYWLIARQNYDPSDRHDT